MTLDEYYSRLHLTIALAARGQLSNNDIVNGLVSHLAWFLVGAGQDQETVESLIEIVRHKLDLAVVNCLKDMKDAQDNSGRSPDGGHAAPDHPG